MRRFLLFLLALIWFTPQAMAMLENGMAADVVIGQSNFNSGLSGTSATRFNTPDEVIEHNGRVLVLEVSNRRILVFNSIPKRNGEKADVVIGQPDFVTGTSGISSQKLSSPTGIAVCGQRLYVADFGNHRIVIWNSIPDSNFAEADAVIGQPDLDTRVFGTSASKMTLPHSVHCDEKRLFVADQNNHRILIWNTIPTKDRPADVVLGQPNFTGSSSGLSKNKLNTPRGIFSDGQRLFAGDNGNFRILIWNRIPSANNTPPDVVVGKHDFVSNSLTFSRSVTGSARPFSDGTRLFAADPGGHRILIWNKIPEKNGAPADFVIGQTNFNASSTGTSATTMNLPTRVFLAGSRLYVTEQVNHRVLIFNLSSASIGNDLGPQFSQGKAVVGKVFWDFDGDGRQDA